MLVPGMIRVLRQTVDTQTVVETPELDLVLGAVVTSEAQRLQVRRVKQQPFITSMRYHMVNTLTCYVSAHGSTCHAPGLTFKVAFPQATPLTHLTLRQLPVDAHTPSSANSLGNQVYR
jgi:hypothetical protein